MNARRTFQVATTTAMASALVLTACSSTPVVKPWIDLFGGVEPGATLGQFVSSGFGGDGDVTVQDGAIHLGMGSPLTGITWTGPPPRGSYELEVTATRLSGTDFFCGLTFPVGDEHLTLILGGWGGAVSGLSCLDDLDAAQNHTRTLRHFEIGRPYVVGLLVSPTRIAVTLDGEPFLATELRGRRLSLRPEVILSRPLGIACFVTEAAVRSVRWRPL